MPENLDLVRSILTDWERGDFSAVEWADPDIELEYADGPSPGTWQGTDRMAEGFRDWLCAWEDWRVEAGEYRELDNERVLVLVWSRGRGKASGTDVATKAALVFHLHDGKVTKVVAYSDRERALADLGLKD